MLAEKRDIPPDCAFLLEFDMDKLRNSDLSGQQYWVYAMKAARIAGRRASQQGGACRRANADTLFRRRMMPAKESLGINDVVRQIQLDCCYCDGEASERAAIPLWHAPLTRRRPHPSGQAALLKSNKRRCKPD